MKRMMQGLALIISLTAGSQWAFAQPIPLNVRVSGHWPDLQNEEQVWICPTDTHIVFANHRDFRLGYRQIGLGRSTNGGTVWTDTLMDLSYQIYDRQSDPVMTVTSSGRIISGHLDYSTSSATLDSSHLAFIVSDNCGATWTGPYTVRPDIGDYFEDKQFVTADRSGGTFDGYAYVSWTRFSDGDPTRILLAASPDGAVTWNDTVTVGPVFSTPCGTISAGQFSQPLVGKDGALYVFWQGYDVEPGPCNFYDAIRVNKSLDAGVTWQGQRLLGRVSGWSGVDGGVDVYSQPTTDCDLSNGLHAGNLYLQYRDTMPPLYDSDILFRRSLDTGNTWSAPVRVNDDPLNVDVDQFHNWIVCNNDGYLASIWYDQRTDASHFLFDVFAGYSYDGGATWTSNHRISSVSINPNFLAAAKAAHAEGDPGVKSSLSPNTPMAGLIAEYIGLSCISDKVVAVWTDTRDTDQDVWGATWQLPLTNPRLLTSNSVALDCGDSLKWATAWKETEDSYRLQIANSPTFASGNLVFSGILTTNSHELSLSSPLGTLHWRVKAFRAPGGTPIDSTVYSTTQQFAYSGPCVSCACNCHADPANCEGTTNILDVVETVNVAFRGDPSIPDPNAQCPVETTDVNCDSVTSILDVVLMVNVAFRGEDPELEFCDPCQ